jgi:hypothetical protein
MQLVALQRGASRDVGTEFFAAFVLEVAMSAENLFAIYLVFRYFRVPPAGGLLYKSNPVVTRGSKAERSLCVSLSLTLTHAHIAHTPPGFNP